MNNIKNFITDEIINNFNQKKGKHKKIYSVMFFKLNNNNIWINYDNYITTVGENAIKTYINSNNNNSKLVYAYSINNLLKKMNKIIDKLNKQ